MNWPTPSVARSPDDDTLVLDALGAAMADATRWLHARSAAQAVPADAVTRLDQCLDEALANIAAHGGNSALPVTLNFTVNAIGSRCEAALVISDHGAAFDPLAITPRPQAGSLEALQPGGLGITLMRHFADRLHYRRAHPCNHLTVVVAWAETA